MATKTRLRQVVVHDEKCCGCRTCEIVCALVNDGECNPAIARLHVFFDQFTGEAKIDVEPRCVLCGECVRWCPTEALSVGYSKKETKDRE